MKKQTDLWLVRHGQTDWNLAGRWQGQASDAPGLNETGMAQARQAREKLKDGSFSAIYSSDLLRARQTAEIIAEPLELQVTLEPHLREMNLGAWEGMMSEAIAVQYPQELAKRMQDPYHTKAPNGESPEEVAGRVLTAVREIADRHAGESVLIVAHGVSLALVICYAEKYPLEQVYEHIPANAEPCQVRWI
ncbi:hypothetical protein MASR2M66_16250 [Chloroflexota bacterium]